MSGIDLIHVLRREAETLKADAHCGVCGKCRKRPPQARKVCKVYALLRSVLDIHWMSSTPHE